MNQLSENAFSLSEGFEAEQVSYRSVSKLAVAALVFGLLASLALIHPLLWVVPVVALVLCVLALRSIAASDFVLTGRRCALCGLGLAMLFGTAAPAKWTRYRWLIHQEAREFAGEWWRHLEQDAPEKAFQLTVNPQIRQTRDETLWEYYRKNPESAELLGEYVELPLIRALLALHGRATFRYYSSENQFSSRSKDWISLVYAVTYYEQGDEQGAKTTFFVRLNLRRYRDPRTGRGQWRIDKAVGGAKPLVRMEEKAAE